MFLEVPLAGLAAANADEETAAALQAAIDEAADHEPGTPPFNEADTRFHQILARAAGNELLLAFTGWILDVLQPQLIASISATVDGEEILRQHRDIQRAVRRRQPAAAEKAMRAHITYLQEIQSGLHGAGRGPEQRPSGWRLLEVHHARGDLRGRRSITATSNVSGRARASGTPATSPRRRRRLQSRL